MGVIGAATFFLAFIVSFLTAPSTPHAKQSLLIGENDVIPLILPEASNITLYSSKLVCVRVYKEESLNAYSVLVDKHLDTSGTNYSWHHIDSLYLVEGAEMVFSARPAFSPYEAPIYGSIVIYKDFSHYKHFLSTGTIIQEHLYLIYNVQTNNDVTFALQGNQSSPRYFIGFKCHVELLMLLKVRGTTIRYSTTDSAPTICPFPSAIDGCFVSLSNSEQANYLLLTVVHRDDKNHFKNNGN